MEGVLVKGTFIFLLDGDYKNTYNLTKRLYPDTITARCCPACILDISPQNVEILKKYYKKNLVTWFNTGKRLIPLFSLKNSVLTGKN